MDQYQDHLINGHKFTTSKKSKKLVERKIEENVSRYNEKVKTYRYYCDEPKCVNKPSCSFLELNMHYSTNHPERLTNCPSANTSNWTPTDQAVYGRTTLGKFMASNANIPNQEKEKANAESNEKEVIDEAVVEESSDEDDDEDSDVDKYKELTLGFMCYFCPLIFTSKELDKHVYEIHWGRKHRIPVQPIGKNNLLPTVEVLNICSNSTLLQNLQ